MIIGNGGIRTSNYKNVDFIICTVSQDESSKIQLSHFDENAVTVSPNFLFHSVENKILLHPSTFLLRNQFISKPLKDTTVLLRKNTVIGQNTPQNYEILLNKLKTMGARIKSRFDSSITHLITDIFDEQRDLPIKKVPFNWIDKCLKNLELSEIKFIETKRSRNIVNKMLGRSKSNASSSVNYDMKISEKSNVLRFCFSNTPQTLKTRITKHLEQYLGEMAVFTEDIETCNFLILGQLKLNEKLIIAMIKGIQVIRASEYDLEQLLLSDSSNEQDLAHSQVSKLLTKYEHVASSKKEAQIVDALNFWKKNVKTGRFIFKNWRILIRTSENTNPEGSFNQQDAKVKSLKKIIKAGGGEYSTKSENFSFTHIITDKKEVKNGEKSYEWLISYILKYPEDKK